MADEHPEAEITINGVTLTHGQSMALRVGMTTFLYASIGDAKENPDTTIYESYVKRTTEIINLIMD